MQFQLIEQEANQLNSQSELISQNIKELNELKDSLEEINNKESKEILVNIGKKIYLPVEIKKKELVVEVGNKSYVNKSIEETLGIVDEQMGKLVVAKGEIDERLRELESTIELMLESENKNHKHGNECDCEEDCPGGKCEYCECEEED